MALTFPHRFDTTTSLRKVVQFNAGVVVLVAVGLIYSPSVSRDVAAILQLTVVGLMAVGAARLVLGLARGSSGTLTTDEVVVERPPVMFGITCPGPSGRFPLDRFCAVRVEAASGSIRTVGRRLLSGAHSRIYLAGKRGTPDVLIARTSGGDGTEAHQFAAALNLPLARVATYY